MHLTQEQWFEVVRFAVLPGMYWALKKMATKAAQEIRDAVDERAEAVATKKDLELFNKFKDLLEDHNAQDEQRHSDIMRILSK